MCIIAGEGLSSLIALFPLRLLHSLPSLLLQPFPYLGSARQVFHLHALFSCASSIFACFSFKYFLIASLQLSFGCTITHRPAPIHCLHLRHTLRCFNGRNVSFFNVAGYLIEERRRWPIITLYYIALFCRRKLLAGPSKPS